MTIVSFNTISQVHPVTEVPRVSVRNVLPYLLSVSHQLQGARKANPASPQELEELSLKCWKAHVAADARLRQIDRERKEIEKGVHRMWSQFQLAISPAIKIHEELVDVYKELTGVFEELSKLKRAPWKSEADFSALLLTLQSRLHGLEESYRCEVVYKPEAAKEKDFSEVAKKVPFGQAVISSLFYRCYKLTHELSCIEEAIASVQEPASKAEELNFTLSTMLIALQDGNAFDPMLLKFFADEVNAIERSKVDGVYMEQDGTPSVQQDKLAHEVVCAQELINEMMPYFTHTEQLQAVRDDQAMQDILERIRASKEELEYGINEKDGRIFDNYSSLMAPVHEGLQFLAEQSEKTAQASTLLLTNLLQSTYFVAAKIFARFDPVSPALRPLDDQITTILESLRGIRNAHNWDVIQARAHAQPSPSIFQKYGGELQALDGQLQKIGDKRGEGGEWRVDGTVVGSGEKGSEVVSANYERAKMVLKSLLF